MKRILFIYNTKASFVRLDEELLRQRYEVNAVYVDRRSVNLFVEMWQYTRDCDAVVAWFASWHCLPAFVAAAIRRIPRVIITGGYDVAKEAHIKYGLQLGGFQKLFSSFVFQLATMALPFSEASYQEALRNTPLTPAKTKKIYLGIPDLSELSLPEHKKNIAFTVATLDAVSIPRKGIDTFVRAAQYLPDVSFIVVGKSRDNTVDHLKQIASPNVEFAGCMSDEAITALRRQAKVYVQPSKHEGFGMAVAESMLARCIPVVSRHGALPELVGDTGIYADPTPTGVAQAVQQALNTDETIGEKARQRILNLFPLEKRAEQLYKILDDLLLTSSS